MLKQVLAVAVVVCAADQALACGGLFCSQVSPTPVDQAAERILFEILDDGSVSATVEIKYQGDPDEFSWIVPVSGVPDFVEVAEKDELQLLDAATAPTFLPPQIDCPDNNSPSFGCASDQLFAGVPAEGEGDAGGVNVIAYPSVGPFEEIVVVEGGNAAVLMAWLSDRGYQVNDKMQPFIEQYTVEGYKFLATQLRSDATVQDMVPIRFHCPQPNPEIPLRLTAIAAQAEMGFLVFVAGPQRYAPLNFAEVKIDDDDLRLGGNGNNYFPLISKRIDEAGGQGFIVERAELTAITAGSVANVFLGTETEEAARASLQATLRRRPFVTRLYSRMNAEEMTVDPIFAPIAGSGVVDGALDLSAQTSRDQCSLELVPVCGALYCGDGDGCAASPSEIDLPLGDGCVCRGSHTARAVNAPTGGLQVVCAATEIDLHGDGNPCAGNTCDRGECVPVNDRPTCRCDDDAVAVVDRGSIRCVERVGPVFESEQLLWPAWSTSPPPASAPPTTEAAGPPASADR
ncbi:MAG: DUF2330 domain-containing protein [Deltaproteobacteria bacterium]|nr:DUF2330 domain-containing protein [Deltaproteobacteria bacterium]